MALVLQATFASAILDCLRQGRLKLEKHTADFLNKINKINDEIPLSVAFGLYRKMLSWERHVQKYLKTFAWTPTNTMGCYLLSGFLHLQTSPYNHA